MGEPLTLTRFLVPLDGSKLAEAVLPALEILAQRWSASVVLLHIIEKNAPQTIHGQPHLTQAAEAERYLEGVANLLMPKGIPVEWHVHGSAEGQVAASIAQHAEGYHSDLILLCAHGHEGVLDVLFGNNALQVLKSASRPILVIPARVHPASTFLPQHVLIPLDGQADHEKALPYAMLQAKTFDATLHFLSVVDQPATLPAKKAVARTWMPNAASILLDDVEEQSRGYLQDLRARSGYQGAYDCEVMRGQAAKLLAERAQQLPDPLMVLASHGRVGLDAFLSANMGSFLSAGFTCPMFLIPA
jgi:nucleotide-binding universal stress UspA family protein